MHTPGPWIFSHGGVPGDDGFSIRTDNASARNVKVICECWPCKITGDEHREELRANGKLIKAAPEMLVVLQEINRYPNSIPQRLLKRCCDAIRKATE